nr:hypothetical protein GCM10025730_08140 [Promicromonospora thailandica]
MPPKGTAGLARAAVSGISRFLTTGEDDREHARGGSHTSRLGLFGRVRQVTRPDGPRARLGHVPDLAASPAPETARSADLRVDLLTREYPPHVYGGAGVHVAELAVVLAQHADVRVRCFDGPRDAPTEAAGVTGYDTPAALAAANPALATLGTDLLMADDVAGADLVHSHTWYANMAGHLGGLLHGVPHVVTAHSLEPLRPGRPSSWAAATRCPRGPSAPPTWVRRASSPSRRACAPTSCASTPSSTPSGCTWCTTAST